MKCLAKCSLQSKKSLSHDTEFFATWQNKKTPQNEKVLNPSSVSGNIFVLLSSVGDLQHVDILNFCVHLVNVDVHSFTYSLLQNILCLLYGEILITNSYRISYIPDIPLSTLHILTHLLLTRKLYSRLFSKMYGRGK